MLKKLQHDKGQELVDMDIKQEYPEKIRSLIEEVRCGKERQADLNAKIENEEKLLRR
jgi:hypothetical protein